MFTAEICVFGDTDCFPPVAKVLRYHRMQIDPDVEVVSKQLLLFQRHIRPVAVFVTWTNMAASPFMCHNNLTGAIREALI